MLRTKMNDVLTWLNPPAVWHCRPGELVVRTDDKTDFWRTTEYGFIRDNGHFRFRTVSGDFSAEVAFSGQYQTLYDQAGLMLRLDPNRWIKTGIEFVDDTMQFSTVVTNDASDWSLAPYVGSTAGAPVRAKLTRRGSTISTAFLLADGRWQTVRVASFPAEPITQVGVMCCSPQRAGFDVRFTNFSVSSASAVDSTRWPEVGPVFSQ